MSQPSAYNILIVCHANTSRSVMAHVLLEKMLADREVRHIDVRSGGIAIYARDGMIASLDAYFILQEHGIQIKRDEFVSNRPQTASRAYRRCRPHPDHDE